MGAVFFHADGQIDTTKLGVPFLTFVNAPETQRVLRVV
jgi:hypothetical protein